MEISPQHGQALQTEVDLDDSTTSHLQNFDKVTIEHTIFFSLQILWTRRQRALGRTVWSKSILPFISILYFVHFSLLTFASISCFQEREIGEGREYWMERGNRPDSR